MLSLKCIIVWPPEYDIGLASTALKNKVTINIFNVIPMGGILPLI
jgi:hypothetical protein